MKIEAQVIHEDICGTCPDFKPVRFSEYLKNDTIKCKHYEVCRRVFGYSMAIVKDYYVKKDEEETPEIVHCKDCKHSYQGNYFRGYACRRFGDNDQGLPNHIESGDFFCGYGERRESKDIKTKKSKAPGSKSHMLRPPCEQCPDYGDCKDGCLYDKPNKYK